MRENARIYVAGHTGLVGSALCRALRRNGFEELVLRTHPQLDLRRQADVAAFFEEEKPEYVFLVAGTVGGIQANSTYPADFIRDNLQIQTNVIDSAHISGVSKLLFFGSSCIYPKFAAQPIPEDSLLSGELEPTNEWYAIAKIAGIKMVQAYRKQYGFSGISVMPTNLYGPGDNFDPDTSHVLPALLRRFHEAKEEGRKEIVVWGSGTPRREFLHVDDLADAALFLMEKYDDPRIINIGFGEDVAISELAGLIARIVGFNGVITYDTSKPDGTPRKLLDNTRLAALGWKPSIGLEEGIRRTYAWYRTASI